MSQTTYHRSRHATLNSAVKELTSHHNVNTHFDIQYDISGPWPSVKPFPADTDREVLTHDKA